MERERQRDGERERQTYKKKKEFATFAEAATDQYKQI